MAYVYGHDSEPRRRGNGRNNVEDSLFAGRPTDSLPEVDETSNMEIRNFHTLESDLNLASCLYLTLRSGFQKSCDAGTQLTEMATSIFTSV